MKIQLSSDQSKFSSFVGSWVEERHGQPWQLAAHTKDVLLSRNHPFRYDLHSSIYLLLDAQNIGNIMGLPGHRAGGRRRMNGHVWTLDAASLSVVSYCFGRLGWVGVAFGGTAGGPAHQH